MKLASDCVRWTVFVFVVLELTCVFADALRSRKGGDNSQGISPRHEWRRRRRKSSECRLGGKWYALNTTWSPNLGPPFGVWSCVQCTCKLVQKKRRKVARVECHNTKNKCVEARCDNPVLLPGNCCKICPDGNDANFAPKLLQRDDVIDTQSDNDFGVLLNGRTSLSSPVTSKHAATGRLSIRRSTLHFSFLLSPGMEMPSILRFMNNQGEVLEELEAQTTPFAVNHNRVCGTWSRMPKQYRQLLRSEDLWVALVPSNANEGDVLSGRIDRYIGVDTEVFSALMTQSTEGDSSSPSPRLPGGGTAIVSVDSRSESLHISLVFNGVFAPESTNTHNNSIVLELTPMARGLDTVKETFLLEKVYTDINMAQVLTTLGETSLPSLTRGKVHIKLYSPEAPQLAIEGMIAARATCNVFSSVLTSVDREKEIAEGARFDAGWAVVTLTDEGFFNYQLSFSLSSGVKTIELQRNKRVVHDLTPSYSKGWANGTYKRPTYGDLDALMRGRLQVSVEGEDTSSLFGLLNVQPITDALRSDRPALIKSVGVQWAASAWVAVDADCVMHYHVHLAGPSPLPSWQLVLQEKDETFDPRLEQMRVVLEEYVDGAEVTDHTTLLTPASLSRLHQGSVSYLQMLLFTEGSVSGSDVSTPEVLQMADLLSGKLEAVDVPQNCRLDGRDSKDPLPSSGCGFQCLNTIDEEERSRSTKCIDLEKNVYDDGSSWPSPWSPCQQCMCIRGHIKCLTEVCPNVSCQGTFKKSMSSQCCTMCPKTMEEYRYRGTGCSLSNQSHPVGSQWHPFLPPHGFDKCVTCSCVLDERGRPKPECHPKDCPPLSCAESSAVLTEGECCKKCPDIPRVMTTSQQEPHRVNNGISNDQYQKVKEQQRVLKQGGCAVKGTVRTNGDEWHPRVSPGGIYKCVKCSCKDGFTSCTRRTCPQLPCSNPVKVPGTCCKTCDRSRQQGSNRRKGGKRSRNRKMRKNRTNDRGRRG